MLVLAAIEFCEHSSKISAFMSKACKKVFSLDSLTVEVKDSESTLWVLFNMSTGHKCDRLDIVKSITQNKIQVFMSYEKED